jgi:hypothetical protein
VRKTHFGSIGQYVSNLLSLRALDHLLDLKPIDQTHSVKEDYKKSLDAQAPSRNASFISDSSFSASQLVGAYENPGYGRVTVCPTAAKASQRDLPTACHDLLARIKGQQVVSAYDVPDNPGNLLIDFARLFDSSHIVLAYDRQDTWFGTQASIIPALSGPPRVAYGKINDLTIWMRESQGQISMQWHGVWGQDTLVEEAENKVEVTFTKV